jgi:nicotinate phosphoribosyltransferase
MNIEPIKIDIDYQLNSSFRPFYIWRIISKEIPVISSKIVEATAYNATKEQCDSTPNTCAWNDKIHRNNRNKIVAVSRDLLKLGLNRNIPIYYKDDNIIRKKIVLDKTKSRFKSRIDILKSSKKEAKKFGKKQVRLYWYEGLSHLIQIKLEGIVLMNDKFLGSLVNSGNKILKVMRNGYVEIEDTNGNKFFITDKPPINSAMSTDFYQFLKMAMYLHSGKQDDVAVFNCFYRHNPHNGSFGVMMGNEKVIEYLQQLEFTGRDIDYIRSQWKFPDILYQYLREFKFNGLVEMIPEGSVIQPHIPLIQITAPLAIGDFIETNVLTQMGYVVAGATNGVRMTLANPTVPWVDFHMRRGPGRDAAMELSRAFYIVGASSSSNVLAGQRYGIPISGTTSHSSVEAYHQQIESFDAQASLFGERSAFILDTYGTYTGLRDALKTANKHGLRRFKVRIDSGDLIWDSQAIRDILDDNGFKDVKIFTSNDIDEDMRILMKEQKAANDGDGIGTKLVPMPLGIVYKLVSINDRPTIKISNSLAKMTDPGYKKVFRDRNNEFVIGLKDNFQHGSFEVVSDRSDTVLRTIDSDYESPDLNADLNNVLKPVLKDDIRLTKQSSIEEIKSFHRSDMELFLSDSDYRDLRTEKKPIVWITQELHDLKEYMKKQIESGVC